MEFEVYMFSSKFKYSKLMEHCNVRMYFSWNFSSVIDSVEKCRETVFCKTAELVLDSGKLMFLLELLSCCNNNNALTVYILECIMH